MRRVGNGDTWRYGVFPGNAGGKVLSGLQTLPGGRGHLKHHAALDRK